MECVNPPSHFDNLVPRDIYALYERNWNDEESLDFEKMYFIDMISKSVIQIEQSTFNSTNILDGLVVMISACHAGDRGSIPRRGEFIFALAQNRSLYYDHPEMNCLLILCSPQTLYGEMSEHNFLGCYQLSYSD
jgi:hypothetical protein